MSRDSRITPRRYDLANDDQTITEQDCYWRGFARDGARLL